MEFHHNPSNALLFPVEAAHFHLADIIANTFKMDCSGESEIIPELDQRAWAMGAPSSKYQYGGHQG